MKRLLTLLFAIVLAVTTSRAYTVETLPVSTQFRDSIDFNAVCNPDGVLTVQEVDSLNSLLWSLREHQGVQGLVIAIHESDPDDPYEFSIGVARKYGVGGKQSLGFVMLVTTEQRGYQILTGDAMEKYLTDADCSWIGRKSMVPHFKEGEWGRGLLSGLSAIHGICNGEFELKDNGANNSSDEEEDGDWLLTFLLVFSPMAALIGYFVHQERKKSQCPQCKKHGYKLVKRVVTLVEEPNKDGYYEVTDPNYDLMIKNLFKKHSHVNAHGQLELKSDYVLRKMKKKAVQVDDHYECKDCKYHHVRTYLSTNKEFYIGTFDGTGIYEWGRIIIASAAATSGGWGGGFGGGSSHSSGGSFHSTFGGGSFSGGGAGGRF